MSLETLANVSSPPTNTTSLVDLTVGQIYNVAATAADLAWAGGDVALAQSLQLHLQGFIAAASQWLGPDGSGSREVVAGALGPIQSFVSAFQSTSSNQLRALGQQAAAGDQDATHQLSALLTNLSRQIEGLKVNIDAARSSVLERQQQFAQFAGNFAGDAQAAQARASADQQEAAFLQQQIAALQAKIDDDRKYELVGWLAGPLGYLIARALGDLIAGVEQLQNEMNDLRSKASQDQQQAITLGFVTGQTGQLLASIDQLVIGLTSLSDSLSQLETNLNNTAQNLTDMAPGPWLNAELDAINAGIANIGQLTTTLAGQTVTS